MYSVCLIVLLHVQRDREVLDARVDLIEVNTVAVQNHTFTQVIFWEHSNGRLHVVAWRMLNLIRMFPHREGPDWVLTWLDRGVYRQVRAAGHIRTIANFDIELDERQVLPVHKRKGFQNAFAPAGQ